MSSSDQESSQSALVLAEEIPVAEGNYRIGVMTLNSPQTMNAVDLEMVNLIDDILARWQQDDGVVAMVMHGAGEKAFCAGGDIRQLYDSMTCEGDEHLQYADAFFHGEYSKNYRVHLFGKPLIAWGHGFVMGGGLGLYIGANHKVATESLKLAWPEVRIGLFPDVAGTYYLSRLPYPYGHWMGLSGSLMNAIDCQELGLIDYCIQSEHFDLMMNRLKDLPWQSNKAVNNTQVKALLLELDSIDRDEMPASQLAAANEEIQQLFPLTESVDSRDQNRQKLSRYQRNHNELVAIAGRFEALKSDNPWLQQGRQNFLNGCPGTAHLIMNQLQDGQRLSLKEVAQYELTLALQSVRHPDFAEGIRAMVVDKDYQPQWQHSSVAEVPQGWLEEFYQPVWHGDHPFKDL